MEQDFSKEDWFVIDAALQKVTGSIRKIEAEERAAKKGIEMKEDTVAIKNVAIYYGIPWHGHKKCLLNLVGNRTEEVTIQEPGITQLRCVACGKLLIPEHDTHVNAL